MASSTYIGAIHDFCTKPIMRYFKIINSSVPTALEKLGYTPEQIKGITDYCKGTGTLNGAPGVNHETLKAKGFTQAILDKLEQSLGSVFDIKFAFNRYALGDDFMTETLKVNKALLDNWDFDLLRHLGFTAEDIAAANEFCCGTMTIEGAPDLKHEHYAVFDCANKCGTKGKRYISAKGHVNIMAAAQQEVSPLTGIIAEDLVVIDFGEHEGKSVLEIADCHPNYYEFLIDQKDTGNFSIRRTKDKIFRLYVHPTTLN